jgi:hypothetical protein
MHRARTCARNERACAQLRSVAARKHAPVAHRANAERVLHVCMLNNVTGEDFMPVKRKNTPRGKAAKSQRRAPIPAPRTEIDVRANESAQLTRREPVVAMSRADTARSRGVDAIEKAIAKEDAKIIAKASARALRRGLH